MIEVIIHDFNHSTAINYMKARKGIKELTKKHFFKDLPKIPPKIDIQRLNSRIEKYQSLESPMSRVF
jgi:hypothetical protein